MKKLTWLAMLIACLVLLPSLAFGNEVLPVRNFEITGGIGDKDVEATFDTYRTVTGTAESGAVVTITLYVLDEAGELCESDGEIEEITVGTTGVFSQDIDLEIGVNVIEIVAQRGERRSEVTVTINRKSIDIKLELEGNNIILPGSMKSTAPKV